jgi:hypothetical protein
VLLPTGLFLLQRSISLSTQSPEIRLLTVFTVQLAILANLEHHPRLHSGIYWAPGFHIVFVGAWLFHFFHHFGKP